MSKRRNLVNEMQYHYTYRITNIKERMHYYGVHSCDCLPKEEIGVTYFSSSKKKEFIKDQKENPQDYKYKVIKLFETRIEANYHEEILHTKFNVKDHKSFYNQHNACGRLDSSGMTTCVDSEGNRYYVSNKDSRVLSGELISAFRGENNGMFGRKRTNDERDRISNSLLGNIPWNYKKTDCYSEETRKQISETLTGRIFVNDGCENINIYPEELEYYISLGYVRGRKKQNKPNKIRVYSLNYPDGILIEKQELEEYMNNGFFQKKRITITKDGDCKSILESDSEIYLSDGWERGMKIVRKSGTIGTKAMHIPGENKIKFVKLEDIEKYIELGYTLEQLKRK